MSTLITASRCPNVRTRLVPRYDTIWGNYFMTPHQLYMSNSAESLGLHNTPVTLMGSIRCLHNASYIYISYITQVCYAFICVSCKHGGDKARLLHELRIIPPHRIASPKYFAASRTPRQRRHEDGAQLWMATERALTPGRSRSFSARY